MGWYSELIEEIKIKAVGRRELGRYGVTMCVALAVLAGLVWWAGRPAAVWLAAVSALFLAAGLAAPTVLGPIYRVWMGFAAVLGYFMSRLILTVLFFTVITPTGLIMRLLGKDILNRAFPGPRAETYWIPRGEDYDARRSEKMF